MKIVSCASEAVPFAKTGGLADVAGALPLALEELDHEVIMVLPGYKSVTRKTGTVPARGQSPFFGQPPVTSYSDDIDVARIGRKIKVYFIKKPEYFNRDRLYGDKYGDYKDNLDRFSYYCKRTLSLLKEINFKPDIIHCHDWQACLIPVYLKTLYRDDKFYRNTKTVVTIHNIGYQGLFPKDEFTKLGLDWSLFNMEALEFYGKVNILKGGLVFCDIINTVSPTYSKEIQAEELGFGLQGLLRKRKDSVFGVLNGLDYSIWNPAADKFIAANFSSESLEDKYKNKKDLQEACGLPVKKDIPLFGVVSRLAEQKGIDILTDGLTEICRMNLQLVILGTGDLKYHAFLEKFAKRYPDKASIHLKFDDCLAHKIYAGSDIFIMPSKYEPCGLGQMISLKYGSIPLVFKTGGLADTVTKDNGFIFDNYTKEDLVSTVKEALKAFADKACWRRLVHKAMHYNFSWKKSAMRYLELYARARL